MNARFLHFKKHGEDWIAKHPLGGTVELIKHGEVWMIARDGARMDYNAELLNAAWYAAGMVLTDVADAAIAEGRDPEEAVERLWKSNP